MFINEAMAQTAAEAMPEGSLQKMIIQFAIILAIFYFILIRPQTKRMKEHREEINSLSVGDKVICNGIFGKIVKVSEVEAEVEISQGVVIKVLKESLSAAVKKDVSVSDKKSDDKGNKSKKNEVSKTNSKNKKSDEKVGKAEKLKQILNND